MKHTTFLLAALGLSASLFTGAAQADTPSTATLTARVIVRFKSDAASVKAQRMDVHMTRADVRNIAETRANALGFRRSLAASLHGGLSLDERTQVITAKGIDSATLVRQLAKDPQVEFVAIDQRRRLAAALTSTPDDPCYADASSAACPGSPGPAAGQWYLQTASTTPGGVVSSINAPAAWSITTGLSSVVVAVIDTGVRPDHPDLAGQFVPAQFSGQTIGGYDMIGCGYANDNSITCSDTASSDAIATNNDGTLGPNPNAADPGDWVSASDVQSGDLGSDCTASDEGDSSWHGTHVSGLIAASTNNSIGMAGVAGGVRILPVRVLGKCGGYDSDIMAGMLWAAGLTVPGVPVNPNPAQVMNMSLGGTGSCTGSGAGSYPGTISAVTAAGATIVVAAGNSEGEAVGVPGNCPGVITVAALRQVGTKVGFSSLGSQVSIAAPGGNCVNVDASGNATGPCLYPILSASNSSTTTPAAYTSGGYYDTGFGTSYSTPLVTGTIALMLSVRPQLTPTEIKTLLQQTSRTFVTTGGTAGTAQCKAPSSSTNNQFTQDECYCTTSTCGSGMLDTGAAVAAAQALNTGTVTFTSSPTSPTVGQTITLTGSAVLGTGRSVASYAWTLVSGGGAVTAFSSGATSSTATLAPTAAGTISVQLAVTDDLGDVYTSTAQSITVTAASTSSGGSGSTSGGSTSSSGGGGGAFSPLWALGLMLACLFLQLPKRKLQPKLLGKRAR